MSKLFFIFFLVMLFSCYSKETDTPVITVQDKQQVAKVVTIRKVKFDTPIEYNKYKVDTFPDKKVNINYSSSKTARRSRSAIKWSIDKFGMNFARHYNISRWGCGTNCINGAITDLKTGHVYDLPPATMGYNFRRDSELLVINPPDSSGYYVDCSYCEPELWRWNESKKEFEK